MAHTLRDLEKAIEEFDYSVLIRHDPEINKRRYAPRKKGLLYSLEVVGIERRWIEKNFMEDGIVAQCMSTNNKTFTAFAPGEIVLYLGKVKNFRAKVLHQEKIYIVPRQNLSAEPVSK